MRLFLIGIGVLYLFCFSYAETLEVASQDCPVEAAAARHVATDVDAGDLNPWREVADREFVVADVSVGDAPNTNRVFTRYAVDAKTGEAFRARWDLCGD